MTREELTEEIAFMLIEYRADGVLSDQTADAILRLVVEACAARIQDADPVLADSLCTTFLPEAREQCKHEWVLPAGNVGCICQHCGALGPMTD